MNNQGIPLQNFLLVHVHLSTGEVMTHRIPIPKNEDEAQEVLQIPSKIIRALHGPIKILYITDPFVVYDASNIICAGFEVIGPEELQEMLAAAVKEPLGFKLADKSK